MGMRGPAPTPTKILEARGSWRAKERDGEVAFPDGLGSCPAWLGKEAKAEWRRMARMLQDAGLAQQTDRALLVAWCEAWAELRGLTEAIERMLAASPNTGHAEAIGLGLLAARAKATERLLKLSAQFGFSPSARARIKATDKPEEKQQSGKARFFAG